MNWPSHSWKCQPVGRLRPWLEVITWARSMPALASATPRSRYWKKSRRPLTSTGSLALAWAIFCSAVSCLAATDIGFLHSDGGCCGLLTLLWRPLIDLLQAAAHQPFAVAVAQAVGDAEG